MTAPSDTAHPEGEMKTYQQRIDAWMREMFATGGADLRTRMDRLIEEVFELAQAHDYDPGRIGTVRDYVYSRPKGDPAQEMGGVMVTLASLACAAGIDMVGEAERELERINTPEVRARIMAKQASKNGLHTPLPTAEAALSTPPSSPQGEEGLWRPISEAPRDGTVVDLWAAGLDGRHGRRIPNCRWDCNRSFNGGIGRVALPDAWTDRGGGEVYFDGVEPTHFRPLPAPPAISNQGKPSS